MAMVGQEVGVMVLRGLKIISSHLSPIALHVYLGVGNYSMVVYGAMPPGVVVVWVGFVLGSLWYMHLYHEEE